MKTSEAGINLIKEFEGVRYIAYRITLKNGKKDVWTIGYGHTKDVYQGMVINDSQATALLQQDLVENESAINDLVKVDLTQNQFDALCSFVHNIGRTLFASSCVLRALNAGKYADAALGMKKYVYSKGSLETGLVSRRDKEVALFLSDVPNGDAPTSKCVDTGQKPLVQSKTVIGSVTAIASSGASIAIDAIPAARDGLSDAKDSLAVLGCNPTHLAIVLAVLTVLGAGLALYARIKQHRDNT